MDKSFAKIEPSWILREDTQVEINRHCLGWTMELCPNFGTRAMKRPFWEYIRPASSSAEPCNNSWRGKQSKSVRIVVATGHHPTAGKQRRLGRLRQGNERQTCLKASNSEACADIRLHREGAEQGPDTIDR